MTKKKKPQGKLDERVIIRELKKEPHDKLYNIAVKAGTVAVTKQDQAKAVIQKVASSSKIQLALARHREKTMERTEEVERLLSERIKSEALDKRLNANEVFTHLNKASTTKIALTKEETTNKTGDTNIIFNIIKPVDVAEVVEGEIIE